MRKNKGLTQKELAERVNLSQQTIGHYEVGRAKPDLETLQKLSDNEYTHPELEALRKAIEKI